jgi:DNA-binding NarL/FixJ family response regulator
MLKSEPWAQGQCRVLIVEKSRLVAESIMFALDSDPRIDAIGYEADAWAAVEIIGSYGPDVVLIGPDVVGLEQLQFTSLVRDFFPEATAIVISKRDRPEDIEDAQTAGATHCLSTESSADELLHTITTAGMPRRIRTTSFGGLRDRLAEAGAVGA